VPQQQLTGEGFLHEAYADFANISDIVGEHDVAAEYRDKALSVAARINSIYLDGDSIYHQNLTCIPPSNPAYKGVLCGEEQGTAYPCPDCGKQVCDCFSATSHTIQSMALFMGLAPEAMQGRAQQRLIESIATHNGHFMGGTFGVKWFLMALSDMGKNDLALAQCSRLWAGLRYLHSRLLLRFTSLLRLNHCHTRDPMACFAGVSFLTGWH
jgi:hypothetical protein